MLYHNQENIFIYVFLMLFVATSCLPRLQVSLLHVTFFPASGKKPTTKQLFAFIVKFYFQLVWISDDGFGLLHAQESVSMLKLSSSESVVCRRVSHLCRWLLKGLFYACKVAHLFIVIYHAVGLGTKGENKTMQREQLVCSHAVNYTDCSPK